VADDKRFRDSVLDTPTKLASMEPDFMDELLVETAVRQARDPDFRGRLSEGRFGFLGLTRQLEGSILEKIGGHQHTPPEPVPGRLPLITRTFETTVVTVLGAQAARNRLVDLYWTIVLACVVIAIGAKV
jgi:hypothetical protein